ncbi:MAG: hypothetical protein R3F43_06940 [bacterium]
MAAILGGLAGVAEGRPARMYCARSRPWPSCTHACILTRTLALFPLLTIAACGTTPTSAPMDHHGHGAHLTAGTASIDDPAQWAKRFDDPAWDAWQKPDAAITRLGLAADAQVADVGAGTGYFAVRLAWAVPWRGRLPLTSSPPWWPGWPIAAREDVVNLRRCWRSPPIPGRKPPAPVTSSSSATRGTTWPTGPRG